MKLCVHPDVEVALSGRIITQWVLPILFAAISLIPITSLAASWVPLDSGTTATFNGIHFFNPDSGLVVGAEGAIFRTLDGGISWVPSDSSGITDETLWGLSFCDDIHGVAVGDGGTILSTSDGGETWVPQVSGFTSRLPAVVMVSPMVGTIVGFFGMILRTTDGGEHWVVQQSGTTYNLHGVAFTDENTGVAVGDWTILRTSDGGSTWIDIPHPMTNSFLIDVAFSDQNYGLAVGDFATILETVDGGLTWSEITSSNDDADMFTSVAIGDNERSIAAGWFDGGDENILRTFDSGQTWATEFTGYDRGLRSVHYDGVTAYATGPQGAILRADDPVSQATSPTPTIVLHRNAPNPFNPQTTIAFDMPKQEAVRLTVYDVSGRLVDVLVDNEIAAQGRNEVVWRGRDMAGRVVSAGVYFYRLEAGNYSETKRMVLVK